MDEIGAIDAERFRKYRARFLLGKKPMRHSHSSSNNEQMYRYAMHTVSYAQNFEDVMLWRALKDVTAGFYIDVGAAWPDNDSVTRWFYDNGWSGINVEPNSTLHALLETSRPRDLNLAVAVGDAPGTVIFHLVANPGLSTLHGDIAKQHAEAGLSITDQPVQVLTLAAICESHLPPGQTIHFLKIDIEGLELAAIKGHDWHRYRPWIVLVEATLPMTQVENHATWEPHLLEAGYRFVYADGLNRFYVALEHETLAAHFNYPPNVFDQFKRIEHQRAEDEAVSTRALLDTAMLEIAEVATRLEEARSEKLALEQLNGIAETQKRFLHEANEKLRAELDLVTSSWSWRLTKPLRKWGRSFQKRKAKLIHIVQRHPVDLSGIQPRQVDEQLGESRLSARAKKVLVDLKAGDGKGAP